VRALLGTPGTALRIGPAQLFVWYGDPQGDTLLLLRKSNDERKDATALATQVAEALKFAKARGLRIRMVVASVDNTALRPLQDRPDLSLLFRAVLDGWVAKVVVTKTARLVRNVGDADVLWEVLSRCNVGLYITEEHGDSINWDRDKFLFSVQAAVAELYTRELKGRASRNQIERARQGFKVTQLPPGLTHNPKTKEILQDHEMWRWVRWVFEQADQLGPDGSAKAIHRQLKALVAEHPDKNIPKFAVDTIDRFLDNPGYVTGEFTQQVFKQLIPFRVELRDPVDPMLARRVRRNLDHRPGSTSKTPLYTFALKHVPLIHAACGHQLISREQWGRHGFRHTEPVPRQCECWRSFWHLADVEDRWVKPAFLRDAARLPSAHVLAGEQRDQLDQQIKEAKARRELLLPTVADRRPTTPEQFLAAYAEVVGATEREIERLERRAAASDLYAELPIAHARFDDDLLLDGMRSILMSDEPVVRGMAADLLELCLDKVVLHTQDQRITGVELHGPLVDDDDLLLQQLYPLQAARALVEEWLLYRSERERYPSLSLRYRPLKRSATRTLARPATHGDLDAGSGDRPVRYPTGAPAWRALHTTRPAVVVMSVGGVRWTLPDVDPDRSGSLASAWRDICLVLDRDSHPSLRPVGAGGKEQK
jgi:DNA invertase Pin-like site-specific DNA recombinase